MTNFLDFNLVFDNLVSYWTGSYTILSVMLIVVFMMVILSRGIDFRYAVAFVLPLVGFFVAIGWFNTVANSEWILNMFLIVVAFFYAFALIRFTT